jgi:hypothetical protein
MENLKSAVIYLLFGLVFVVGGAWISSKLTKDDSVTPIRPLVSCPSDFLAYSALSEDAEHVVKLISQRKQMFAENGEFINSEIVITKNETKTSKVACGYLFVRSGTQNNGSLQNWENLYINPNDFGGHIDSKNQFGIGDGADYSEYLFSLKDMEYWKTRKERAEDNLSRADWAALLNVSERVSFDIALNTEDKTAFIDELSIAYKCWNPETGEENSDCKLKIETKSDSPQTDLD